MNLTKDVIKALEIAESYLEQGDWVDIRTIGDGVHINIGTVYSSGFMELPHIIFTVRNGFVNKHRITL